MLWFRKYHASVYVLDLGTCALCKEVESINMAAVLYTCSVLHC